MVSGPWRSHKEFLYEIASPTARNDKMGKFWVVLTLLFFASSVCAQESPRIRNISIERVDVFDAAIPSENRPPYTWANKIHILTREGVIGRELLLERGSLWDPYLKEESERNLRAYSFIKNARIEQIPVDQNSVDLKVRTQDTWTTELSPSLGTQGGKTSYGLYASEKNFLGLGKSIEFIYSKGFDRTGRRIYFLDPRVLGSRVSFEGFNTDHADGYSGEATLKLPAYSLIAPFSMGLRGLHSAKIEETFSEGEITSQYRHENTGFEAASGKSLMATSQRALRLNYGYQFIHDQFDATSRASSLALPEARTFQIVKVGMEYVRANYINEDYIGRFERFEDFNLAPQFNLTLGYSTRVLGAPGNELLPVASFQMGKIYGPGNFMTIRADTSFRYQNSGFRHIIQALNLNYYRKSFLAKNNTFVAHGEMATGLRLDRDAQLILGGDTGLRGYKINAFAGTRSFLVNAESRWYLVNDWLHLFSLAPVVFWDAGYVWPNHRAWRVNDLKHDVGFGLRIGATRSATNPVIRMDVSYALNEFQAPSNRWLFSLAIHHAFKDTNNALRRVLPE